MSSKKELIDKQAQFWVWMAKGVRCRRPVMLSG